MHVAHLGCLGPVHRQSATLHAGDVHGEKKSNLQLFGKDLWNMKNGYFQLAKVFVCVCVCVISIFNCFENRIFKVFRSRWIDICKQM